MYKTKKDNMPRAPMDYSKSMIYKIVCRDLNIKDCYIGSTTDFRRRKYGHKTTCNNENGRDHHIRVYQFIRENGGWENWDMVLVERYPCEDRLALLARERYWIEELKASLNKVMPRRTDKEYREQNKERLKEYKKKHYEENKEKILLKHKEYRENNKERLQDWYQKYRENNSEKIKEKDKRYYQANNQNIKQRKKEYRKNNQQKIECTCGALINKRSLSEHRKSKKHKFYESVYNFVMS